MIFVDSEIVRVGNDQILNNLKEGVVILHEKSDQVVFANNAAEKQFNVRANKSFQMSFKGDEEESIDLEEKIFTAFDIAKIKTANDTEQARN